MLTMKRQDKHFTGVKKTKRINKRESVTQIFPTVLSLGVTEASSCAW